MNNPVKVSHCVKCELQNEKYTDGHVRICPYRLCPCKQCQEHDQLLAALEEKDGNEAEKKRRKIAFKCQGEKSEGDHGEKEDPLTSCQQAVTRRGS
jgi:hypothetical protein